MAGQETGPPVWRRERLEGYSVANVIVLLLVVMLLALALKGTIKHFKGEGPCCCGGACGLPPTAEKKLEQPVMEKMTIHVSGMHCQNCVNTLTRAIDRIDGASARVSLSRQQAVVSCDRKIGERSLRKAVEDAGYQVVSIESQ